MSNFRAKCYSIAVDDDHKLAAAGVKRAYQRFLKHHQFVETLVESSIKYIKQRSINSKDHTLYTQEQNRVALSAVDIKRFISDDRIHTVPHGYFQ